MSLLDKASLIVTPNAYKESKLYSVVPNTTLGDMDVVRATTATRVNSAGLIEVVPRNLLAYSNDLTNGIWTKTNTTITLNTIANPLNGLVNGQTFTPNTTNADHFAFGSGITVAGQPYIMSFFVKANGYTNCRLGNAATGAGIWFNLSNGTIISGTGGAITALSNGWYLVSYSLTSVGTSVNPLISFAPSTSTNFAGNGTSGGYVFGAQLDQGSTATEYFPTTTRLNIPRIDYTNGSCPSLLVEPQRTNLLTYNNTFSDISWFKPNAVITLGTIISPDGLINSSILTDTVTNSSHVIQKTLTVSLGQSYSISIYAKKKDLNFLIIGTTGMGTGYSYFNINNGTIGNVLSGHTAKIINANNGWYKCVITGVTTSTVLNILYGITATNGTSDYVGTGLGNYIYGTQVELGSYDTSLIPTVASTVTRNADVISKTGVSSLIGQTEGVIFLDCKIYPTDTKRLAINDGTIANVIFLQSDATNRIRFLITQNSISILDTGNFTLPNPNGFNKIAFKYKSNDFAIWVNGTKIYSSTAVALSFPVALSKFAFDFSASGLSFFGEVKSAQLYKTALTDTELQSLTTL